MMKLITIIRKFGKLGNNRMRFCILIHLMSKSINVRKHIFMRMSKK
jgi:hypothetical protein